MNSTQNLDAVGFVFDNVKTNIKWDNSCKYSSNRCQMCPQTYPQFNIGKIAPCNSCSNSTQYKVCIFKLKKEYFVSSSLGISTTFQDAWEQFVNSIIYQTNGNFVISVTKCDNSAHSFYANLLRVKKCSCCDAVILYFKYNIVSLTPPALLTNPYTGPDYTSTPTFPINTYKTIGANYESNITWNIKSGLYKTVRFFNSQNYDWGNELTLCGSSQPTPSEQT
jgi:hypothetical protein